MPPALSTDDVRRAEHDRAGQNEWLEAHMTMLTSQKVASKGGHKKKKGKGAPDARVAAVLEAIAEEEKAHAAMKDAADDAAAAKVLAQHEQQQQVPVAKPDAMRAEEAKREEAKQALEDALATATEKALEDLDAAAARAKPMLADSGVTMRGATEATEKDPWKGLAQYRTAADINAAIAAKLAAKLGKLRSGFDAFVANRAVREKPKEVVAAGASAAAPPATPTPAPERKLKREIERVEADKADIAAQLAEMRTRAEKAEADRAKAEASRAEAEARSAEAEAVTAATLQRLSEHKRRSSIEVALDPPPTWTQDLSGLVAVDLSSSEAKDLEGFLRRTSTLAKEGISKRGYSWPQSIRGANIEVVSISRVQNMAMWRHFAMLCRDVVAREGGATSESAKRRVGARYLFHGCSDRVVTSILEHGFNRSYSIERTEANKKGGSTYGCGTYFARHAGYSMNDRFSKPDANGVSCVLLCQVVIGEYCQGRPDTGILPPLRDATRHLRYDTTVDTLTEPEIFVTYKDYQAYPEYLIKFKKK